MSVKIKVSYERPEELQRILDKLYPGVKSWRVSGNREGKFLKAYIFMKEQRRNSEE
ncbi:hypothetical protein [Clostridium sp. AN503]|uniref:hypothetical protein n=1 Tax=Clostridium sp. AN503 TaxID=3160598 RepID=UPI003458A6A2